MTEILPLFYSVTQVGLRLGCGRTKVLALVRAGRLEARQLDGRMKIAAASLDAFAAALPVITTHPTTIGVSP